MKKRILIIALAGYLITALVDASRFGAAIRLTGSYLLEMVKVLPAVFVLSSLLLVWVPRELIMKTLGAESGWKGKLLSLAFGSLSAGPIYAAFPVAAALLSKGASLANVVIIISSWAVVKVPMLIVESSFLGVKFAAVRYLLTVPTILAIGYITPLLVGKVKQQAEQPLISELARLLPGLNCGACGFATCSEYARHVLENPQTSCQCRADSEARSKIVKTAAARGNPITGGYVHESGQH